MNTNRIRDFLPPSEPAPGLLTNLELQLLVEIAKAARTDVAANRELAAMLRPVTLAALRQVSAEEREQ